MTIFIIILYGILGLFLLVTLVNVSTGPRLSHPPKKSRFTNPTISVLVPARNEEHNLPACLESLLALDPAPAEILVLDDHSTDKTREIIQGFAFKHKQIRGIRGKELPAGWVGKTWACHQLSQEASGEILVFTDADNTYHPAALERSVRWMQALNLDMLSAFPQQTLKTLPEKLVIPVVDLFVYSMLPLWLTRFSPFPSLAAANGQWMVFRKEAYDTLGGHKEMASEIVEDVAMSRKTKKRGLHLLATPGTGTVYGRMYRNAEEVRAGFAKNLFGLTGFHSGLFFLIFSMLLLTMVIPYGLLIFSPGLAVAGTVILNLLIRMLLVLAYRHPPFVSIVLHPISILYTARIALHSWNSYRKGSITWKGRAVIKEENTR